ncbi:MAG: hypothetical protein QM723_28580 [Myxococcaceae bacterium]
MRLLNRRIATIAGLTVLGAIGLMMAFYPTVLSGFAQVQQDPHDTRHLNFVLENGWLWLTGHAELFSPNMFYPLKGVAAYTEVLLGVLPFYVPYRLVGLAPDTSFQCWVLTVATLNYLTALFVFRRGFHFGWAGTAAGAFLFSFGSPRLTQVGHQHLIPQFYTLLALYGLARLFRAERWGVAIFCAGVVLQAYAGIYFAWFLGFSLGVALIAALAMKSSRATVLDIIKVNRVALAAGAALSLVAVIPLALPYLHAAREVGYRSFGDAAPMLPRIQSWFYQGDRSWLYRPLAYTALYGKLPMWWEHSIGVGFVTLGLCVWSFWRERSRPLFRVAAVTLLSIAVLTMYFRGGWSPWWLVFKTVPGAAALRAVSRIGILMLVPWSLALAQWFDRTRPGIRGAAVAAAVAMFCIVEQGQVEPSYDKQQLRDEVGALVTKLPASCDSFFYSPQSTQPYERIQVDAMWAGLLSGKKTANGYSSNFPPGFDTLIHAEWTTDAHRDEVEAGLHEWERSHGLAPGSICVVR